MSLTERLPLPDWTRERETWRVEPEPFIEVMEGGVCTHQWGPRKQGQRYPYACQRPSIAVVGRSGANMLCELHLTEQQCWIEDGKVVSWTLRP